MDTTGRNMYDCDMIDLARDLRPHLLHWSESTVGPWWTCEDVEDDHTRIYLPIAGSAWLKVGRRRMALRPGACFLIPPVARRALGCDDSMTLWWLHCRPVIWEAVDLWRLARPRLEIQADVSVTAAMERIASLHGDNPLDMLEGDGLCRQLLARFLTAAPAVDQAAWVRPIVEYIEAHLHEKITASDLAARAGWDRAYFSRRFREVLGVPPMRLVRLRRVQRARSLLASSDWTVEAVAARTGFHDAFHLSRTMHQLLGVRPSEVRRRAATGPALP